MLKYKIEDYIGKKYGHLKVLGKAIESNVPNCFLFLCDCGREISLAPDLVIKGHQKSCGKCLFSNESPARIKPEDYIGKRNNLLTVVSTHKEPKGRTKLICLCDCGKTTEVLPYQFKKGSIKSCGCLLKNSPNYLDGRSANELYGLWKNMLGRCENPNHPKFYRYGARGIKVCNEWHNFWSFVSWSISVGGRPNGFSLDRINNDKNYCPENCRWADSKIQSTNKSTNRIIEYNGVSKTLHEWETEIGISDQSLSKRLQKKWPLEKVFAPKSK